MSAPPLTCAPDKWTQLVKPKNKELFRIELFNFPRLGGVWIVDQPACSLKNEVFFQIGLMDRLRVVGVQLVDRSSWSLENKKFFQIGLA